MARTVKKKTPKKKDLRIASAKQDKPQWPRMVMGVKVNNQKEMDKMIDAMYGRSIWNKRGSLGS
tara:strand:- start:188 stop:379 length:192 start_codon:yes stop_codon:yes gene_type:complete